MLKGFSDFPTGSSVTVFAYTWDAGISQLVSEFLTGGIGPLVVESVCLWGEKGPKFSVSLSC